MANFETYQQYQRIEDLEEESPAGEEDLLLHVPEGLKGKRVLKIALSCSLIKFFLKRNLAKEPYLQANTISGHLRLLFL